MEKILDDFLPVWTETRGRTEDLLATLTDAQLRQALPRPGLDSVLKHLQEMIAVESCFVRAITSGSVDMSNVPDVFAFSNDVGTKELLARLEGARSDLHRVAESPGIARSIGWFGDQIGLLQLLLYLLAHEVFHQGQLTALMYAGDIPIPQSWISNWALPPQSAGTRR